MSEFKVEDRVYLPILGAAVYQVKENGFLDPVSFPLRAVNSNYAMVCFTKNGRIRHGDGLRGVFHATPENHALLEQLYGVEFEKPPVKPTSREIIQAMLARGDKYVCCWVSDDIEEPDENKAQKFVFVYREGEKYPYGCALGNWKYATPFDRRTGKPITEIPT